MMKVTKTATWLCALAISVGAAFDLYAGTRPEKIYRKALPAVMTLEVENFAGERFVGSAVLGLSDDIAITAWHVVSDARKVAAVFADGTRLRVDGYVARDVQRDLALLKLERPLPGRKAVLSRNRQAIATRVFVIGAPKGYDFSISDGLVSQVRKVDGIAQYQISCPISPGNSGGPLLNDRCEVIGITSWTKSDAQNLSFAIPAVEIARLDERGPVVPWEKLAPRNRPAATFSSVSSRRETAHEGNGASGFDDFRKRLERSAGKPVTIVVREEGQENTYQFIVPSQVPK